MMDYNYLVNRKDLVITGNSAVRFYIWYYLCFPNHFNTNEQDIINVEGCNYYDEVGGVNVESLSKLIANNKDNSILIDIKKRRRKIFIDNLPPIKV